MSRWNEIAWPSRVLLLAGLILSGASVLRADEKSNSPVPRFV